MDSSLVAMPGRAPVAPPYKRGAIPSPLNRSWHGIISTQSENRAVPDRDYQPCWFSELLRKNPRLWSSAISVGRCAAHWPPTLMPSHNTFQKLWSLLFGWRRTVTVIGSVIVSPDVPPPRLRLQEQRIWTFVLQLRTRIPSADSAPAERIEACARRSLVR